MSAALVTEVFTALFFWFVFSFVAAHVLSTAFRRRSGMSGTKRPALEEMRCVKRKRRRQIPLKWDDETLWRNIRWAIDEAVAKHLADAHEKDDQLLLELKEEAETAASKSALNHLTDQVSELETRINEKVEDLETKVNEAFGELNETMIDFLARMGRDSP